ncbi:MAG: SUMF1/EgtB/PvdO family nonheme iron enzyme, partial [Planctomycetota bacterium JB042]
MAVEQIRGEGGFLGLARRQLDSLEERARDEVIRLSRVAARRSRLRVADSGASSPVRVMSELGDILARALWTDRLLGEFDRPTPDLALDLFRPSLDLSRYPADATIRLHPIDPETGLPLRGAVPAEIPPGPRDAVPADLGRFRVIASTAPGRYAEDDVLLDRPIELRRLPAPRFVDLEDLRVSMVLHEAGTLRADAELPSPRPLWFQDRPPLLDVPAFLLDRHEVTNEDYRRFVLETGHRPPLYWPKGWRFAWEERWDRLPVSGVSVDDAEAFARWAGKRLPTALELEVAVRTHEGFASVRGGLLPVVPIGNVRSDARRRVAPNPFDLLQLGASEEDELRIRWTRYLLLVEPAGGTPGDRSPAGVLDLTGNVREWTSTPAVELGERVSVDTRGRVVSGSCF